MRIYSNKKRPVKASNDGRKWVNTELTQDEYAKFRDFLKQKGYKYETSGAGDMVHIEAYLNEAEIQEADKFLDTLDGVNGACGKKSVKSNTHETRVDYLVTIPDLTNEAAALYDGGWRDGDQEELMEEYGMDRDHAEDLCLLFKEYDRRASDNIENACSKKSVKSSTRRRAVRASAGGKIPYDLVSSLVILRDWAEVNSDDYVSDEHRQLVDIADFLYNADLPADNLKPEAKAVYDKYGESYFNKVLRDVSAIDSQISHNNVNDLIDEFNDKVNAYMGWGVNASTRRRPVRASMNRKRKPIMAGAGAGYTINWTLDTIRKVNSFDVTDVDIDEFGLAVVRADCDVDIEVTIRSAWSYMYGFDHPISNVPAKLLQIEFELALDGWNEYLRSENYEGGFSNPTLIDEAKNAVYQINEMEAFNILEDEAWNSIQQDHYTYGGGWSHSTWDGTISELDEYHYATIQVTDQMVIDYVDKAVTDENIMTEYWIDFYLFRDEYFDTLEEARATAIQAYQSGELEDDVTIMKTEWHEILLNIEGESDFDDPEQEEVETLYADDYIVPSEDEE